MSDGQPNNDELDLTELIDASPQPTDMRANVIFAACIIGIIAVIIFIGNPQQKLIVSDQQLDDASIQRAGQQRPRQEVAGAEAFGPLAPSGGIPTPTVVATEAPEPTVAVTVAPTATPAPTSAPSNNNNNTNPTNTPSPEPTAVPSPEPTASPTDTPAE